MDFAILTSIPIDGTDTTLRPVYDRVWGTFTVQIHKGDVIHHLGLNGNFTHADEPLDAIDEALAGLGVRELTELEAFLLHAGLVYAKGGGEWLIFCREAARAAADTA
ncbi:hypothetical protein ACODT4_44600 [Streptomyces sp. 2.9]|uniref:hypothetical protein n=1 Tax=Streptomyces tritrimontium TaxID=3406573 RepID=UPI003BB5F366